MLLERTEGWAAGLQLYLDQVLRAKSLRKDARSAWLAVRGHVDHFFVDEMVANYPDEMRLFLTRTSILGQFSGPLCDAVLDTKAPTGGSTATIQKLRQENCLLEVVGSSARWYRYHRLLRTVLEDELHRIADSSEIDELHRRASRWLADNAFVEQAVYHAHEAGDAGLCAQVVAGTMETLFNRDDWPALDRALSQLSAEVVQSHPDLLLARAWVLHFRNRYGALTTVLDQFEERIQSVTDSVTSARYRGHLATLRGFHAFALGDSQGAISHGQEGLELLPEDSKLARGISSALIGMGLFWAGRGDDSERELLRLLESEREPHPAYRARVLQAVLYLRVAGGNLVGLEQSSRQLIALSAASDLGIAAGWGHLGLGIAAYERNDLDAARQHFSAGIALRDRANAIAAREARLGLAQVSLLLGSQDMARGLIASAIEASELAQSPADLAVEYSFQARLKLAEGRLDEAVTQLRSLSGDLRPTLAWAIEAPAHTRVKILLAQGDESHLHEALEILETLAGWYESHHEAWRLIQVRALQALTLRALGREAESLDALAWALEMAAPWGLLRTFLDLGPPMAALLNALPRRSRSSAYHTRLLTELRQLPTQQLDPDEAVRTLDHSLYEALTWREIEILQLLEARLSNKEIAGTLSVSVETVKKHAANIYRKLNVQGRRQAVNRGHDLRILSGAM
jgi:LuxR family maltose regulon positive regulatory protein